MFDLWEIKVGLARKDEHLSLDSLHGILEISIVRFLLRTVCCLPGVQYCQQIFGIYDIKSVSISPAGGSLALRERPALPKLLQEILKILIAKGGFEELLSIESLTESPPSIASTKRLQTRFLLISSPRTISLPLWKYAIFSRSC